MSEIKYKDVVNYGNTMYEYEASQLPINQAARSLYYADESLRAMYHSRGSKLKGIDPVHILKSRVAYEQSKQKLNSGKVDNPYGV